MEQNQDISKFVPLFECKKLKTGGKMEQNQDISKFVPLFECKKLKIGKKLEQNQDISKFVPLYGCRVRSLSFENCGKNLFKAYMISIAQSLDALVLFPFTY